MSEVMFEFTVLPKTRKEDSNIIEFSPDAPNWGRTDWDQDEPIHIGDYPYGCEGEGHWLGTYLPPGRYGIIEVEDA